jgi:tetratricopeptide (TPR) repeat protein
MGQTNLRWGAALPLACALSMGDARAEGRWVEVKSPHFRVLTDAGEKEGRNVATGFEQLRKLFAAMDDMRVDPPAPIVIVATRDEAGLKELLPSFWERRGGMRPGGVFLAGTEKHHIALRLDVDPEFRDDIVYHEYVHLIVRLNFKQLPVWLNEGLAEFYAGTRVRDGSVLFGIVNDGRLAVLREGVPLPLADLFAIDDGSREYNEESRASILYAESALLTHYFMVGDRGAHRNKLTDYMRLLSQGVPDPQAQAQAFGDLKALQKAFFSYVHRYRFAALKAPLDLSGSTATARTMSEAEVLAVRGEFLARYWRAEEARPVLTKARQADPGLAAAAQALGVLESEAGRPVEARRQLADAIKLAPDDFASHFLRGARSSSTRPSLPRTRSSRPRCASRASWSRRSSRCTRPVSWSPCRAPTGSSGPTCCAR